jgi:hypothetical protein
MNRAFAFLVVIPVGKLLFVFVFAIVLAFLVVIPSAASEPASSRF